MVDGTDGGEGGGDTGGDEAPAATPGNFHEVIAYNARRMAEPEPEEQDEEADEDEDAEGDEPADVEGDESEDEDEAEEPEEEDDDEELIGALKGEDLPAKLMSKRVTATIDGKKVPVTVEEAVRGYQRASHYTQQMQALREQEREMASAYENKVAGLRDLFEGWKKDPTGSMQEDLEALGLGEAFEAALIAAAKERYYEAQTLQVNPQLKDYFESLRKHRKEAGKAKARARELEWAAKQKPAAPQGPTDEQKVLAARVERAMVPAFKAAGLDSNDPDVQKEFGNALRVLYRSDGNLQEIVEEAVRVVDERMGKRGRVAKPKQTAKPKLPPVAKPGAAPRAPKGGGGRPSRMSPSQWAASRKK